LFLDGLFTFRVKAQLLPNLFQRRKKDVQMLTVTADNQVLAPGVATHEHLTTLKEQMALFYENFDINDVLADHVRELARRVKANGGQFVLMELPNRSDYQFVVDEKHADDYNLQKAAFARLAGELGVPFLDFSRPDELGLTDDDYEDYGHITPTGAKKVTHVLAGLLNNVAARPSVK
jgi:hypothetical protein